LVSLAERNSLYPAVVCFWQDTRRGWPRILRWETQRCFVYLLCQLSRHVSNSISFLGKKNDGWHSG
jgi:hypothetical protein